ncbi:MAG: hypothetical protein U9M94_04090 [Patescibacteria group bacterium]|nr:hypothetical protein [Patescibacteria group bacterium]
MIYLITMMTMIANKKTIIANQNNQANHSSRQLSCSLKFIS